MVTVQKMKNTLTPLEKGIKYYSILSILNNLGLSEKQIQLLAFTQMRGNISSGGAKELFIQEFGGSKPSIFNMIHKLKKSNLLVMKEGKVVVNSKIALNFNNDLILQVCLETK